MLKFKHIYSILLFFAVMLILSTGCGKDDDSYVPSSAQLEIATVNYFTTTARIATSSVAGVTYQAEISAQGDTPWCSFDINTTSGDVATHKSGDVSSSIYLYLQKNLTESDRTATIAVTFSDNYTATLTLTQLAYSSTALYDRAWGEQPVYREGSDYIYKAYHTTFTNGTPVRNYSICYSLSKHVSYWVAYPVHKSYTKTVGYKVGSTTAGRTDAWAYDDSQTEYSPTPMNSYYYYKILGRPITQPEIPTNDQQSVFRGYGSGGYQRGHMLPSASRYNTWKSNAQTFYATNLMPQNGDFNGGIWGSLEGKVRSWAGAGSNDTLFVVTGTLFKTSKTINNANGPIAVPSHCWKVLLRVRNGAGTKQIGECTADELKAIGFIFTNDGAGDATTLRDAACSVSEIEQQTGFEFFRNLSSEAAGSVKNQKNYADWSGL